MLHLTKLAVGVRDIDHLREVQAETSPHAARHCVTVRAAFPAGTRRWSTAGRCYWVVNGCMLVRQRIVDIIEDRRDDGSACTGLVLDPALVPLAGDRPSRSRAGATCNLTHAPPDLALGHLPRSARTRPASGAAARIAGALPALMSTLRESLARL